MSKIVVFGAGGKAGREIVKEAVSRGHGVTAVVRDPAKYDDLAAERVQVVAGDITNVRSVTSVAAGHDVAIHAVYDQTAAPEPFFVGAAHALLESLPEAGVKRALIVGLVSTLEVAPGQRVMDTPDFPEAFLEFCKGHAAGLEVFRSATTDLDWLVVTPPMVLDQTPRTGTYRVGGDQLLTKEDGTSHLSYADLAVALIDEAETPKHHQTRIAVAD
ncbi:NAD(P)-dependent oxidoreductase [Streptomyces sp. NPDC057217]|uniref:NAD(P)-dependent oxidoreductase n=1 Tax=Streptomyces sp. NPDC057217 TaxID=3346054 RepID=UPI0036427A69